MAAKDVIKDLRINLLCMEQAEFAEALGITKTAICCYEKGIRVPKLSIVRRMRELARKESVEIPVKNFLE